MSPTNQMIPYFSQDENGMMEFHFGENVLHGGLTDDGESFFWGYEVTKILKLKNPRSSIALLDDDEKGVHSMDGTNGIRQVLVISESGLYSLVLRSRIPEARAFKRWLTHDVLPALRKLGGYISQNATPDQLDALRVYIDELERQNEGLIERVNQLERSHYQLSDAALLAYMDDQNED